MGKQEDMRSSWSRKRVELSYLEDNEGKNAGVHAREWRWVATVKYAGDMSTMLTSHMIRMGGTGPSAEDPTKVINPTNFLLLPSSFTMVEPQYLCQNCE
jgi:hypothetical protein